MDNDEQRDYAEEAYNRQLLHPVEELEPCCTNGYLIGQTYGTADVPDDWQPVQRCDECQLIDTDEDAARIAARDLDDIDRRVHFAWFPGGLDDEGYQAPGEWAIGPNL